MKFQVPIDMQKLQIQNLAFHNLASAPSSPVDGQVYYNTTDDVLYYWNGTSWQALVEAGGGNPTGPAGGSLTGTYPNPTIADNAVTTSKIADGNVTIAKIGTTTFDNQVRTSRLDQMAAPTASVSLNSQRITSLATPTAATDAATKAYVDGVAAGLSFKDAVRVATTAAGTLASGFENGDTVDGVTLATGDRILIKDQSSAAENGIYTVNASGAPTRAVDADASGEIEVGTVVYVQSGTANGFQMWVCTATGATPWVPGSSTSTWALFFAITSTQAGAGLTASGNVLAVGAGTGITVNANDVAVDTAVVVRKFAANMGDGSATSFVLTHNLNTRDVTTQVYLNSGTFEKVECDVEHTTVNTVTVRFAAAPATNAYRAVVHG